MKNIRLMNFVLSCLVFLAARAGAHADGAAEDNGVLGNDPVYIVQTLMNNNYMNMKHLYVAIMNYGGGEKEFYALLDSYSRGMTLYLHRKMPEAADLFRKNEAEIKSLAVAIAKKYRADTEKLHEETVKMYIQSKIRSSMDDRTVETGISLFSTGDTYINNASDSIRMANRYMETGRPIDAISYYRKSKGYCFEAFDNYRVKLPSGFELDLADNGHLVYAGPAGKKACTNC